MCVNGFLVRFCWWDWCVSLRRVLSASVVCVCAQRHAIMCGTRKRTKKNRERIDGRDHYGRFFSYVFVVVVVLFHSRNAKMCVEINIGLVDA